MRKLIPGLVAIVLAWGFAIWAGPQLPDQVVTHWGLDGQPDGWSGKRTLVLVMPLLFLATGIIVGLLPRIDPRRREVAHNAPTYWLLANSILMVLAVVHVATVGYNLGWPVSLPTVVSLLVGGLFVVIGNYLPRMRTNWFMGIRTPWTLSSERVWRRTHRLGGYCFMAAGLLIAATALPGISLPIWGLIVGAVAAAVVPVAYSYFCWRAEQEAGPSASRGER